MLNSPTIIERRRVERGVITAEVDLDEMDEAAGKGGGGTIQWYHIDHSPHEHQMANPTLGHAAAAEAM
jgi:hypothetical protein